MQTQIEFLVGGANSLIGGFCAGDTARVSVDLARHLVDELGIAKYLEAKPQEPTKPAAKAKK